MDRNNPWPPYRPPSVSCAPVPDVGESRVLGLNLQIVDLPKWTEKVLDALSCRRFGVEDRQPLYNDVCEGYVLKFWRWPASEMSICGMVVSDIPQMVGHCWGVPDDDVVAKMRKSRIIISIRRLISQI